MKKEQAMLLIEGWYSEQIPADDWIRMLEENSDLKEVYEKEKTKRES